MDINSATTSLTSAAQQQRVGDAVGMAVLKKAMDVQSDSISKMVNSTAESAASPTNQQQNLPDHLGQNINTVA